jgi:hypothetical protein
MSEYRPGASDRGTCPHCDRRVKVSRPDANGLRTCYRHRPPDRYVTFWGEKVCGGSGLVCREECGGCHRLVPGAELDGDRMCGECRET